VKNNGMRAHYLEEPNKCLGFGLSSRLSLLDYFYKMTNLFSPPFHHDLTAPRHEFRASKDRCHYCQEVIPKNLHDRMGGCREKEETPKREKIKTKTGIPNSLLETKVQNFSHLLQLSPFSSADTNKVVNVNANFYAQFDTTTFFLGLRDKTRRGLRKVHNQREKEREKNLHCKNFHHFLNKWEP